MLYLVFRSVINATPQRQLPPGYSLEHWQPGLRRIVPPTLGGKFISWWVLHYLRIFRNRNYSALIVRHKGQVVHRTCLVPKYFRWGFMDEGDLQVSSTWTAPAHRCLGLASYALHVAAVHCAQNSSSLWYVTRGDNVPSLAVCRNIGFQLLTEASRTGRFGLRILGQLVLLQKPGVKG